MPVTQVTQTTQFIQKCGSNNTTHWAALCEAQKDAKNTAEQKAIATKFALNEMKLNKWSEPSNKGEANAYAIQWESIYQTVWLEKLMQVKVAYDVAETLSISKDILTGQQKIITALGVIVNNQGQILQNQEIIITNQGIIIDVTNQILTNTEEIIATTNNILGIVQDIQMDINDISANGVTIKSNNYSGGSAKAKSILTYVLMGLGGILLVYIVLKIMKKRTSIKIKA